MHFLLIATRALHFNLSCVAILQTRERLWAENEEREREDADITTELRGIVAETLAVEKLDAAQLDTSAPETGDAKTLIDEVESIRTVSLAMSDPRVQSLALQETSSIKALQQFAFKREVLIQMLDRKGNVNGEYHRISQMVLDDSGSRIEKIMSFAKPTLKRLVITKEDIENRGYAVAGA